MLVTQIKRFLRHVRSLIVRLTSGSVISNKGKCTIHKTATITNCNIRISKGAELVVNEGCVLSGVHIKLGNNSKLVLEPYARLIKGTNPCAPRYKIINGVMHVGHHSVLALLKTWIRFGGVLNIGCHVNINENSEIRADEKITIGDYGMISYYVKIWDTNVHCIYSEAKRAELKRMHYPHRGIEIERPDTAAVSIGSGVWLGERVGILKGCHLGNDVIVGYNATLINQCIPNHTTVVQKATTIQFKNNTI